MAKALPAWPLIGGEEDLRRFIAQRAVQLVIVLVGASSIVFVLMHATGDPVALLVPADASVERIEELRELMGFNDPFLVQYFRFLRNVLTGRFPPSIVYGESPVRLLLERLPATLLLGVASVCFACVVAFPIGLTTAWRRDALLSTWVMGLAIIGYSTPVYWGGLLLILVFSVALRWLPASGSGTLAHLVLPAVSLGTQIAALLVRMIWSTSVEVIGEDYIRTARGKGLSDSVILRKHVLRNSMIPVVTVLGLETAGTLGNAIMTETIFAWPGIARLTVQAILYRDYPLVQACVLFMAGIVVLTNLLVDIIYVYLDPRVRLA